MPEDAKKDAKNSWDWKEIVKLVLIAAAIVFPFRYFIAKPFVVEGASMYPTFKNGQYLIVDEFSYRFKAPERGSVLIFNYPKETPCSSFPIHQVKSLFGKGDFACRSFIKRVIGLPGEIVSIKDGKVTITSSQYPDGLTLDEPYIQLPKSDTLTYTLGQGEYFVMGDNRAQSADSRLWGTVPEKDIIGRPVLRVVPFSFLPGDYVGQYVRTAKLFTNNNP